MNRIALYIRLSISDDQKMHRKDSRESESVSGQRALALQFLAEHADEFSGYTVEEYVDDGYSGTTDNRPAFQRMLEDIRRLKINIVICKDFSRLARNYLLMGELLEQIFPFLGVRFIAINNHYDSAKNRSASDDMSMVVSSIMNSRYSLDLSVKMKASARQRQENGTYPEQPCYGYLQGSDRRSLDIDPEAAKVVRRIFDLALSGMSTREIADSLNLEEVPTPAQHMETLGTLRRRYISPVPIWRADTVRRILTRRTYDGSQVMRISERPQPCSNRQHRVPPSEQLVRKNAHEAIVSPEEFARVQEMFPAHTFPERKTRRYPLKGLIRCGTCKRCMMHNENGVFRCRNTYMDASPCLNRVYAEKELEAQVMKILGVFFSAVLAQAKAADRERKRDQKEQAAVSRQITELEVTKKQFQTEKAVLYEQYIADVLTLKEYTAKKQDVYRREAELNRQIQSLTARETALQYCFDTDGLRQAAILAKQFSGQKTLTVEMTQAFLEAVYLYGDGMEIHWKFQSLAERITPELPARIPYQTEDPKAPSAESNIIDINKEEPK